MLAMLLVLSFFPFSFPKNCVEEKGKKDQANRFFKLENGRASVTMYLIMKHDFEQRKQNRIAGAKNRAAKNEAESEQLYLKSKEMASVIPMGQPIIIGHHSEKRDRNYRDKIHNTMGRSVEKSNKAAYYAEKAEAIESNTAIFSDDLEALLKLEQKLATLKGTQDFMKAANKAIRKNDREGFLTLKIATAEMWDALTTPHYGSIGFPSYRMSNNNANIKRIEQRITSLKRIAQAPAVDKTINGVRIFGNVDANRVQVFFEGKPASEVIKQLKSHGFRWCRSEVAWQRHISRDAYYWAESIANSLSTIN